MRIWDFPIIRRILFGEREDVIEKWRRQGVPEKMINLALLMADRWIKGVSKAIAEDKFRRSMEAIAPPTKVPKREKLEKWKKSLTGS